MTTGTRRRRAAAWWPVVLGLLVAACMPAPLAVPDGPTPDTVALSPVESEGAAPTGAVTVAVPAPPSTFLPTVGLEPAAGDLAAIWGLPLFRVGPDGRLRRGLVADWNVRGPTADGWVVVLRLRPGRWSDGSPVEARDVVATVRHRVRADPDRFAAVARIGAPAADRVRLVLTHPHAGWSDLLLEIGPILPAEVAANAENTFDDDVPVSGGPFRLVSHDPGRRMVFQAHPRSPLGPPRLARLVVLFVPSFETALGLLDDRRVDVIAGHLALNPVARSRELEGVRAAAPIGGTTVAVAFRDGGGLGGTARAAARRGIVDALDVAELVEGLLGPIGAVARSPWPAVPAPASVPHGAVPAGTTMTLVHPQEGEALGYAVRALQRDLRQRDVTVELVPVPRPEFTAVARREHDASLQVRRTGPRPTLVPWVEEPVVARHAAAALPGTAATRDGLAAVATASRLAPLFRIGVTHAWRDVEGVRPSSWLGAGFWNVGEWHRPS